MSDIPKPKQLLHLVIGGELDTVSTTEFRDLDKVELVGVYPNYATAYTAWKARAQGTVDNAQMRYFIVHLHRLLDPESPTPQCYEMCGLPSKRVTAKVKTEASDFLD